MSDNLDKYKSTIGRQIRKILCFQLVFVLCSGFLGFFLILNQSGGAVPLITGIILIICQIMLLYCPSYSIGDHDTKSYSELKPYAWKGFALSAVITVITVILAVMYKIAWSTGELTQLWQVICNFVFIVWIIPYYPFTVPDPGAMNVWGMVAVICIPMFTVGFGYLAGMTKFDLSVFTDKFVYENDKDVNNNDK